tara:strand:- start:23 stop:1234 length:1212 start_codon:yes stop_codon:yes gene_type:complete
VTYEKTVEWMFAQLPMYQQKGPSALNAKLDNIKAFAEKLGSPERKFKSIHVGGTNGKGSCSHMLASVLQEAGYKVGLYTSPHLKDFRERIKINGAPISKSDVIRFIERNRAFLDKNKLSFFEMTVGMAFDHFANEGVDIAIIEVGLGGRLDSTNIIKPEVSLITNIGYDHMQFLGNTLEKIALEKAGIIKRRVPVVIGETQPETEAVFRLMAAQKKSDIVFADQMAIQVYETDLLGSYQKKNQAAVVACLNMLEGFEITEKNMANGLKKVIENTQFMGRWHVLQNNPTVVCDTAHNREGINAVLEQIGQNDFRKLHMVLGFVADKDLDAILPLFPKQAEYYFVKPSVPRGLDQDELALMANEVGLAGTSFKTVSLGLEAAQKAAQKEDFIFVGGSTFVVAEVV